MAAIQYLSLLFLLYSSVDGHSWPENPRPRQYRWAIEGGCVEDETGKVVRRCTVDKNSIRITLITCIHTHTHSFFFFFFFSLSISYRAWVLCTVPDLRQGRERPRHQEPPPGLIPPGPLHLRPDRLRLLNHHLPNKPTSEQPAPPVPCTFARTVSASSTTTSRTNPHQ